MDNRTCCLHLVLSLNVYSYHFPKSFLTLAFGLYSTKIWILISILWCLHPLRDHVCEGGGQNTHRDMALLMRHTFLKKVVFIAVIIFSWEGQILIDNMFIASELFENTSLKKYILFLIIQRNEFVSKFSFWENKLMVGYTELITLVWNKLSGRKSTKIYLLGDPSSTSH